MFSKLKAIVISSKMARYAFELVALLQFLKLKVTPSRISSFKTIYTISPYKTGTYYLSSLYQDRRVRQQPLQHLTLKLFNRNFDKYFEKRNRYLNLRLECSGLFSGFIDEILKNPFAREQKYICILRTPSSWITSVIRYWIICDYLGYDSINHLYWRKRVGVDLRDFPLRSAKDQASIIAALYSFYMEVTAKTMHLPDVHYFWIQDLENKKTELHELVGLEPGLAEPVKNENKAKASFMYANEEYDLAYEQLLTSMGI